MTSVIEINQVSKRFIIRKDKSLKERLVNMGRSNRYKDDFWALRDVTLSIESGNTIGLIGPNGSGKSTLLKTIGGIIQPTSGSVNLRGRLAALLELGAGFHPDLTGRENVYLNAAILGITRKQTAQYFDAMVDFSGIERFIDTQVKYYSSGMYVRLAFAVAVHVDPDILLVDEVLAVGDEPFQRKCMDRIRAFQVEGRTIVLVTHALAQVAELCDRAVVLESGTVRTDAEPRDALRTLRSDFQDSRHAELSKLTKARAQVLAVELVTTRARGATVTLEPGGAVTFRVLVEAQDRLEGWELAVGVEDGVGFQVLETSTKVIGATMPSTLGERVIEIVLDDFGIGSGDYAVTATLTDRDGREIHRLLNAAVLSVTGNATTRGPVYARATARVPE